MAILKDYKGIPDQIRTGISSETWVQLRRELDISERPTGISPNVTVNPDILWRVLESQVIIAKTTANHEQAEKIAQENGCDLMTSDQLLLSQPISAELPDGIYLAKEPSGNYKRILINHKRGNLSSTESKPLDMLRIPLMLKRQISIQDWDELRRLEPPAFYPGPDLEIIIGLGPNSFVKARELTELWHYRLPDASEIEKILKNDIDGEYWAGRVCSISGLLMPVSATLDPNEGVKIEGRDPQAMLKVALVKDWDRSEE